MIAALACVRIAHTPADYTNKLIFYRNYQTYSVSSFCAVLVWVCNLRAYIQHTHARA